jgi:hypothetical protein
MKPEPQKKFMDDYNYHDWSEFMVEKPEKAPKGPHFGAVLFGTRSEADSYSGNSYYDVPTTTYFAFPTREVLEAWIIRALKSKKKFFFFEVKKLGEAEISVKVDTGL